MPELPEVETIVRDLKNVLLGLRLTEVKLLDEKWGARYQSLLSLLGYKVQAVRRLAKMIIIDFGDCSLAIHLKMTGQLVWRPTKGATLSGGHPIVNVGLSLPNKFSRVLLNFGSGQLFFNDVRKFGWLKIVSADDLLMLKSKHGPDPVVDKWQLTDFCQLLAKSGRRPLKAWLLDQTKITGLGNIYVDEVLFASGLRPTRLGTALTEMEIKKLFTAIPRILKLAIKHRGTSFSDYRDGQGERGNFRDQLQVYGRGGQPCLICGRPLNKNKVAGRGTHWCENCQN